MAGLRVLMAASEVAGFAKTGGLADVAGALPKALARRGHQVAVVMPYYNAIRRARIPVEKTGAALPVPMGDRVLACRLLRARLPGSEVPVYLVEHPPFFERDDSAAGRGLYQQVLPGGAKTDYPDNAERYIFFSKAVLETAPHLGFIPDVVHVNDWQTGLVPVYLNELYRTKAAYRRMRSLLTIHNIAYQGQFGRDVMKLTGLPMALLHSGQVEFYGCLNFLKAGIVAADAVNTVSPTYAHEIRTPEYGCGLNGLLNTIAGKLSGIVNGIDYSEWNPATDPHLPAHYNAETLAVGKPVCKAAIQRHFHLPESPTVPVLGMVARLVGQKGIDLVLGAAPGLLDLGCQMVFLGDGDPEYHAALKALLARYPDRIGLHLGFDEGLAHRIEAGADLFLMPSRYEPCGLNQLYSLRYGTPPVVRATGGLRDTVVNATAENLTAGTATGFAFDAYTASALYDTVKWALHLYRDRPADFLQVVRTAMAQDWSWDRSAAEYEALYRKVIG